MGSPVVLLSATLPKAIRQRLICEYLGGESSEAIDFSSVDTIEYPRITVVNSTAKRVEARTFDTDPARRISIDLKKFSREALAEELIRKLFDGGTAVVICNTVRRAQEVYLELEDFVFGDDISDRPVSCSFHVGGPARNRRSCALDLREREY